MTQVCARCDSGSIVPDYEKGKQVGVKCMMCGHDKFKEVDMSNKTCEAEGCERKSVIKGVCYTHPYAARRDSPNTACHVLGR